MDVGRREDEAVGDRRCRLQSFPPQESGEKLRGVFVTAEEEMRVSSASLREMMKSESHNVGSM